MKNYVFIFALMTAFIFSCSNESLGEQPIQESATETNNVSRLMSSALNNTQFVNYVRSKANTVSARSSDNDNSNGVMVIQDPFSLVYASFSPSGIIFVGAEDAADNTISFLPNGMMRFQSQSNEPTGEIISFGEGDSYSTACYDNAKGSFNANVAGFYEEVEIFPGFVVYEATEYKTASIFRGNVRMNNAQPILDENFEVIDCTESTDEITLKWKLIFRDNNGQGLAPIIDSSIK